MIKKLIPILFLALILVACQPAADGPRQIASYPNGVQAETSETYSPPIGVPQTAILVYDASLDLAVWNVDDAANSALQKAADYGGYLSASNLWNANGQKYATLTFALPAGNYDQALAAFKRLGTVNREQVSGKLYSPYSGQTGWDYTSHIPRHTFLTPHPTKTNGPTTTVNQIAISNRNPNKVTNTPKAAESVRIGWASVTSREGHSTVSKR